MDLVRVQKIAHHIDSRGSFTRISDSLWGVPPVLQISVSTNLLPGTLRGMHASKREMGEFKVVTCLSGSVVDFVIDLRPESSEYGKKLKFELQENNASILIPPGCVHGFLTLEPNTEILYAMSAVYKPEMEVGFRWNDPLLAIDWPKTPEVISSKDAAHPLLDKFPVL
jgi:dTDP-4-dehydrorhamnose 3,5-epimerase